MNYKKINEISSILNIAISLTVTLWAFIILCSTFSAMVSCRDYGGYLMAKFIVMSLYFLWGLWESVGDALNYFENR